MWEIGKATSAHGEFKKTLESPLGPSFPGCSAGKKSASQWDKRDPGSIPRLGRSPGEGNGNTPPTRFSPGESHGQRRLVVYSPWGHRVGHDWVHMHCKPLIPRPSTPDGGAQWWHPPVTEFRTLSLVLGVGGGGWQFKRQLRCYLSHREIAFIQVRFHLGCPTGKHFVLPLLWGGTWRSVLPV